jgi:hypothetical protein
MFFGDVVIANSTGRLANLLQSPNSLDAGLKNFLALFKPADRNAHIVNTTHVSQEFLGLRDGVHTSIVRFT